MQTIFLIFSLFFIINIFIQFSNLFIFLTTTLENLYFIYIQPGYLTIFLCIIYSVREKKLGKQYIKPMRITEILGKQSAATNNNNNDETIHQQQSIS